MEKWLKKLKNTEMIDPNTDSHEMKDYSVEMLPISITCSQFKLHVSMTCWTSR